MGKGSGRRPGTGYDDGWDRIFGKKEEDMACAPKKKSDKDCKGKGKGKKC